MVSHFNQSKHLFVRKGDTHGMTTQPDQKRFERPISVIIQSLKCCTISPILTHLHCSCGPRLTDQEPHVRRGHPIVFGLILLFALIEGCLTAWLGMSFSSFINPCIVADIQSPNSTGEYPSSFLSWPSWHRDPDLADHPHNSNLTWTTS
jgi:hypothetical protein